MNTGLLNIKGYHVPSFINNRKRRRTAITNSSDGTARATPHIEGPTLSTPTTPDSVHQLLPRDDLQAVGSTADEHSTADQGKSLPSATHLSGILPPMMLSSIVKSEGKAAVEMIQSEDVDRSWLRFSIYPHRASYLAKELFDVDASIENTCIHLRLESGVSAKVSELNGASHGSLEKCFGKQITAAIRSTRQFRTELQQGEIVTRCVLLQIRGGLSSISLELDPDSSLMIPAEIWPPVSE